MLLHGPRAHACPGDGAESVSARNCSTRYTELSAERKSLQHASDTHTASAMVFGVLQLAPVADVSRLRVLVLFYAYYSSYRVTKSGGRRSLPEPTVQRRQSRQAAVVAKKAQTTRLPGARALGSSGSRPIVNAYCMTRPCRRNVAMARHHIHVQNQPEMHMHFGSDAFYSRD